MANVRVRALVMSSTTFIYYMAPTKGGLHVFDHKSTKKKKKKRATRVSELVGALSPVNHKGLHQG